MSHPVDLKEAQQKLQQVSFGTSREREFFKYLPSYHWQTGTLQHVTRNTQPSEFIARPSPDSVLTAFAQLGALRLNSKRALISLFGRNEQHILTEATRTLSLQDNTEHTKHDGLWIGSCTMSYDRSFCRAAMESSSAKMFVVPDLTQDEQFKDHQDVINYPHIRFLAYSPIVSPKGIVIGAYLVLDDKPHGPMDTDLEKFLVDISNTVMDYLSATKSRNQQRRSERMITGLGSFLDGKGSLRNSWSNANEEVLSPGEDVTEGQINERQQEKQVEDSVSRAMTKGHPGALPFRPSNYNTHQKSTPTTRKERQQLSAKAKISTRDFAKPKPHPTSTEPDGEKRNKLRSKELYATQIKETFSRAANIIRESIEVEAAVFFDAKFGSKSALVNAPSDSETSGGEVSLSSEDDAKVGAQRRPTWRDLTAVAHSPSVGKNVVKPCKILGFSASAASSVNDQLIDDNKIALSEDFLRHLLRRYPRGKIFNYSEDGVMSASDTGDGKDYFRTAGKKYKKTSKTKIRQDSMTLLQIAPDARSIIFSPLWDSHKERWHSCCLSWTKVPHRVFTSNDELSFLFAFGNSVMAEVHRLAALLAESAKADLLAGISHELRSPLHGIFGVVDLLVDTSMNASQRGFLHTISSCASTLLGSIDQLLEYASINDVRPKPSNDAGHLEVAADQETGPGKIDENFTIQLDAAMEESIESVCAGHSFLNNENTSDHTNFDNDRSDVSVVLDIDRNQHFKFATRPGAWHVILTNILGNALKFTKEGYIFISLKTTAVPVGPSYDGKLARSKVTLSIADTGCGMEEDFVQNEMTTAFSQEDNLSSGNGLGLNITSRLVLSLGGNIQVASEKDVGTKVVTTMFLDQIPESGPSDCLADDFFPIAEHGLMSGKTISIVGLSSSEKDVALYLSLQKLCRDWLEMDAHLFTPSDKEVGNTDFCIVPHAHFQKTSLSDMVSSFELAKKRLPPPVIVICSSLKVAHSMSLGHGQSNDAQIVEFISQPCGPRKLAKTLETCLRRQQQQFDLGSDKGEISNTRTTTALPLPPNEFERHSFLQLQNPNSDQPTASNENLNKLCEANEPSSGDIGSHYASEAKQPSAEEELGPQQSFPRSVLLVEDNAINMKLLIAYMKKLGCNYLTAQNGQEALDCFRENAADIAIILMDISMPVMDGLESTRQIRALEHTMETKDRTLIYCLTGVAQAEIEHEAMASGMDMFLTKPVRLEKLLPLIEGKVPISPPKNKQYKC
ncbi:unnamed protein product [Penicillium bialowiezense]